jgi:cell division protein FtsZ
MDFQIVENESPQGTIIKVVGVGGAGNNAVQHMISKHVQGVEFICLNTDSQALNRSAATHKLRLGKTGLGAGARPEVGKILAEEAREEIKQLLSGAHMVFITAGMGGGTGTGAAPVVARIAKEMGILTVGVVSKPFEFEGLKRMNVAEIGANELQSHVDSLIVVLNERLFSVMGEDAEMDKCFECADDVLHNAVAGIAEIINVDGLINVDFEDVKTVMSEQGKAMMGTATVSGTDRARLAAEQAVSSPLLEGVDLSGARGILVNITASRSLKLSEIKQVMNVIRSFAAKDATVIFGSVYDENMGEAIRVTVVATGLGGVAKSIEFEVEIEKAIQQYASGQLNEKHLQNGQIPVNGFMQPQTNNPQIHTYPQATANNNMNSNHLWNGATNIPQGIKPATNTATNNNVNQATNNQNTTANPNSNQTRGGDMYDIPAFLRRQNMDN